MGVPLVEHDWEENLRHHQEKSEFYLFDSVAVPKKDLDEEVANVRVPRYIDKCPDSTQQLQCWNEVNRSL